MDIDCKPIRIEWNRDGIRRKLEARKKERKARYKVALNATQVQIRAWNPMTVTLKMAIKWTCSWNSQATSAERAAATSNYVETFQNDKLCAKKHTRASC